MKFQKIPFSLAGSVFALALTASTMLMSPTSARAQQYWDINGSAAGATSTGDASGVWDSSTANWTTNSAGTIATTTYSTTSSAVTFSAGTNTVTAAITVSGSQALGSFMELQEGAYAFTGGDLLFQGGGEMIRHTSSAASTIGNNLVINDPTSTGNKSYTLGIQSTGGDLAINGNIGFSLSGTPGGVKTVALVNSSATSVLTFAGQVTGTPGGTATSSINVGSSTSGNGVVVISGDNSALNASQSGQVTRGVVLLQHAKAMGTGTINIGNSSTGASSVASLLTNGAFTIANNITLGNSVAGATISIGGNTTQTSTFSGAVNLNGSGNNSLHFSSVAGGRVNFDGVISATNSGPDIIKDGGGVVAFNAANTYNRVTQVTTGTLLVNNTTGSGTGTNAVTVASGATLGGTGTIGGITGATSAVTISGTLAPGDANSIGTLTIGSASINRDAVFTTGSFLSIQTNVGMNNNDRLTIYGNLDLSGTQTLTLSGTLDGVNDYVIATFTGSLTGTFENVVGLSGNYVVQYNANNITLSLVPEPSTLATALFGGLGLLLVIRRNRRGVQS